MNFFSNLFSASNIANVEDVCSHLHRTLNSAQVALLSLPFTNEDIEKALNQMGPLKAPGSDGIPAIFFQKHWK